MQLSETQQEVRDLARSFARREIAPHAAEWDRLGSAPRELYSRMAEVGLMGMMIGPEWGGAGLDFTSYALAMEEISAGDGGVSNVMAANNSPVAVAVENLGSEQQKQDYLTKLTSGEWIGSIHLTEPHTGSDAAASRPAPSVTVTSGC
jgi:alkylation response protein AidB-like acyl-CoA dehydrogenase